MHSNAWTWRRVCVPTFKLHEGSGMQTKPRHLYCCLQDVSLESSAAVCTQLSPLPSWACIDEMTRLLVTLQGIDLEESVRVDIKALKDSPLLTPASKNKLTGYIYDVKSGGLHTVPA